MCIYIYIYIHIYIYIYIYIITLCYITMKTAGWATKTRPGPPRAGPVPEPD